MAEDQERGGKILQELDAWEAAARDYQITRGPISSLTAIQDTIRRQQLAELPVTTESALAAHSALLHAGETISRLATRLGIDATPLDAFLMRPDPGEALTLARIVVKHVRQKVAQRTSEPEPRPAPPESTGDVVSLCATEAAELLGISPSHFHAMQKDGRLGPRPCRLGRAVRWMRQELLGWLAAGSPPRSRWEAIKKGGRK